MLDAETSSIPAPSRAYPLSCGQLVFFIAIWLWVAVVTFGRLLSQVLASAALTQIPIAAWIIFPLVQGLLLTVPLIIIWLVWRAQPWRGMLSLWLAASLAVLLLAPVSLLPLVASQAHAIFNILLLLVFALILRMLTRRSYRVAASTNRPFWSKESWKAAPIALLAVALTVWPWFLWGALGSFLDTLLQILVGLVFGWVISISLDRLLLPALRQAGMSYKTAYLAGGFAAGTAVMIFASALSYAFGGLQTLLALSLPPLGWLAIGIVYHSYSGNEEGEVAPSLNARGPVLLLFGLAAAAPLALIDPDELAIVISASAGELLGWSLQAAATAGMIGLVLSAAMYAWQKSRREQTPGRSSPILWIAAGIAWLVVAAIYFLAGQPGFHGEQLFVLLEAQPDLTAARAIADPTERRQAVYAALVAHAQNTQEDLRLNLERFNLDYTPYYLVNGVRVRGGPLVKAWLSRQAGVAVVLDAPFMRPLPEPPPTATGSDTEPGPYHWNLELIGADRVQDELGFTGEGIVIGQSDSGVQGEHPELADSYHGLNPDGSLSHAYNWYDPWNESQSPVDIGGHGTHTLGSVLGNNTGVAPDAQWIGCTNLARNLGNLPYYLDCMQFMLAPFPPGGDPLTDGDPSRGANVLNNSWGCPEIEGCSPTSLAPAVYALASAGIFVVASAGNDGPLCSSLADPIAIYDSVFTVGASDPSGYLAFFSSVGPVTVMGDTVIKPDLIAPGEGVFSSMPEGTYGQMTGTSMAGPHVAGTVALMWSANPNLIGDIATTRQILQMTATLYSGPLPECPGVEDIPSTAVGYGLLDAYAAVQYALER